MGKLEKKALIEAHCFKILTLVIVLLGLISLVSAWEFDNIKSYNQDTKTATITNAFGLGDTIAELKLESELNVYVIPGKDRKVAEFTISNYQEGYKDAFKRIRLYNKRDMRRTDDRTFVYKYATYSSKEVDVYENVCDKENKCQNIYQGKRTDTRTTWNTFTSLSELPKGDVRIGIFTNVYEGDYVEWIPTFFGVEIDEWATWSDSLSVDLERYWAFDDNSTTTAREDVNSNDLTIIATHWTAGKINSGYNVTGENSPTTFNALGVKNLTINLWLMKLATNDWEAGYHILLSNQPDNANAGAGRISWMTQNNPIMRMTLNDDGGANNFEWTQGVGTWNMTTIRLNDTAVAFFVDGEVEDVEAVTNFDALNVPLEFFSDTGATNTLSETRIDEVGIWSRALSESEISDLWNGGAGLQFPGTPSVTLNLPADDYETINKDITFNCTATDNNNVTNITLYIDGVANYTEIEGTGDSGEFYQTINDLSLGTYNWTCSARDDENQIGWASTNRSLSIQTYEETSVNYNSTAVITSEQNIVLNLTYDSGVTSNINAVLNYAGTNRTTTKTGSGDNLLFSSSLNPASSGNNTFYWTIIADSVASISNRYNQTISEITFGVCNASNSVVFLNFTSYDEKTSDLLNITFDSNFQYGLSTSALTNFTYTNSTAINEHLPFCVSPGYLSLVTNLEVEYDATNYQPRKYYLSEATITNTTSNINLYLLNDTYATKFFFTLTEDLTPISNAIVSIAKYDVGTGAYKNIGIRESDEVGEFIEYLELDQKYQFSISQDGTALGTIYKTATCSASPCEMDLELTTELINAWAEYYDTYASNVVYNLSYNPTTKMVYFVFTDTTGLADYFRLEVSEFNYNQSSLIICNSTLYSTSGTLTCNLTGYDGDFRAETYISRSPEKLIETIFISIKEFLEEIGTEGLFITLLLIVVLAFIGLYNPLVGISLTVLAVLISFWLGFFGISWGGIIVIVLLALYMMVKMGRSSGV